MRLAALALTISALACSLAGCAAPRQQIKILKSAGAATSLVRLTTDSASEWTPRLSPDGSLILFCTERVEGGRSVGAVLTSIDADSGARRTIYTPPTAFSAEPRWLPDGSGFVYRSNRSGPLAVVRSLSSSPNSGVSVLLDANQAPSIQSPSVSPDGKTVAAQALISGQWNVILFDTGRNQYTVLGEGISPCYSPDGGRILFIRTASGVNQIFSMNAKDGTDLVQVTTGQFANYHPSYSPDGRWIVFASNRSSDSQSPLNNGTYNLFACRTDGSEFTALTDGTASNLNPEWAKNGRIYFSSDQAGSNDIWSLEPEGALKTN